MFNREVFAERLRNARNAKHLSQTSLGKAIGVTTTQISDMETQRRTTTIEKLYALAEFFEVSADYLIGLSDDPSRR